MGSWNRNAEHRADAALAQDRIDHVRPAQVLDYDRPPLSRDAARKATCKRHLHALADLLLQAAGGARDERPAVLVEQEDGSGVHLEHRADALEQLGEHFLQRHVGERRVGDLL